MSDFKHTERISRQQAAERLTDVAYAMVVRAPVTLRIDGERVVVPDAEELLVDWDISCADGRLELQMEVHWPAAELEAVA
jgi:amphi-Trp domain-containing protein